MRILLLAGLILAVSQVQAEQSLLGFDTEQAASQLQLEANFDELLSPADQDAWLRELSAEPHHVGSAAGQVVAQTVSRWLTSWGYDTSIETYQILLPTPRVRKLDLIEPELFSAELREDSLVEDPSTAVRDGLLPPYNAFSADGTAEGELVFINYGRPEDHELLERYGISLKGKVAIAKYGKSWRGIKPKLAAEKGAVATIIYSDPADDGYGSGDVYPVGPYKHASAVQRGSVMDMPVYPGDVLTPGEPAIAGTVALAIEDVTTITKIPVLPISYRDALPLLKAMGGSLVPQEWVGGLPITYHLGPGPARVRLTLEFNWDKVPAYNVIAKWPGSKYPNEWIIRGNHHDGWNHGAADPLSGLVALLAEAKAVAGLIREGYRPARTLVYAAWDAEEPGLIGSTEWVEHHAQSLSENAVAYINTDGNSRGFLNAGGSHSLERFLDEIASVVNDPRTGVSVKARLQARLAISESASSQKDAERPEIRLYPLGSGSDYTPFLQHLGIASLNLGFGGEGSGGSYHTLYDTYQHYTQFRDPGLMYGQTLAQVAGRATLRLANADRLPFEFANLVDNIAGYVKELEQLADTLREQTARSNRLISSGQFALALDPEKALIAPTLRDEVPFINFAPLKNALHRLQAASTQLDSVNGRLGQQQNERVNKLLYQSERLLTRDHGLPNRPWYRHHIYAPGLTTGYGVKTIPGVREAIEVRDFDLVDEQILVAAEVVSGLAAHLTDIANIVDVD
ncbi:MAG: M28 family peptidase [Gammaproteobacteria bacterium]|nr:M28 family peptidase [Gammaproteobacteria bacterium]